MAARSREHLETICHLALSTVSPNVLPGINVGGLDAVTTRGTVSYMTLIGRMLRDKIKHWLSRYGTSPLEWIAKVAGDSIREFDRNA